LLDLLLRSLAIQENILSLAFFVHLGNVPLWELVCPLRTTPFGLAKCVRNVLLVTKHRLPLILHLRAGVTGSQNLVTLHHKSGHGSERVSNRSFVTIYRQFHTPEHVLPNIEPEPPVRIRIQNRSCVYAAICIDLTRHDSLRDQCVCVKATPVGV